MKSKTTQWLALVFLTLLAYVYFFEIKGKERREQAEEAASKLLQFNADSLSELHLLPEGIHFVKKDDQWYMSQPVAAPADEWNFEGLLNSLRESKKVRSFDLSGGSPAEYGLQPPRISIVLRHEGVSDSVFLGSETPAGGHVYARLSGDPQIHTVESALFSSADKSVFDFRDKTVMKLAPDEVDSLSIVAGSDSVFALRGDPAWQLLFRGKVHPADEDKIRAILNALDGARIKKFVEESAPALRPYGLNHPRLQILLGSKENGRSLQLFVGKKREDFYYAMRRGAATVFALDTSLVQKLSVTAWDLVEKKLARFSPYEIDYFELYRPTGTLVCRKIDHANWQIVAPDTIAAKSWEINELLGNISRLQAASIVAEEPVSLRKYGLENPEYSFLARKDGQAVAEIKIGKKDRDHFYAIGSTSSAVVRLPEEDVAKLNVRVEDLANEISEKENES